MDSQIEKLDDVAESLEELWISYNQVTTLDGLSNLSNLTRLYMSNNSVKNWAELDKLVGEGGGGYDMYENGCAVLGFAENMETHCAVLCFAEDMKTHVNV